MEDKMAARASGHAKNYGWGGSFFLIKIGETVIHLTGIISSVSQVVTVHVYLIIPFRSKDLDLNYPNSS